MEFIGELLREWRIRRRMSQGELAADADISTKHLSFLETGRSRPSRHMLLRLVNCLDVPLRERNRMLQAAGFAPAFPECGYLGQGFDAIRQSVGRVLTAYGPIPALVVDRHWTILAANQAAEHLFGLAEETGRGNILRHCLHPAGLAPRIVNLAQWHAHIVARLRRQIELHADPVLVALLDEIRAYQDGQAATEPCSDIAIPLRLATDDGVLSFFGTTTHFDAPVDITASELAIEAFMPADAVTADLMQSIVGRGFTATWPYPDTLAAD